MLKQPVLKWGADTVIKFLEIYNSYEVLWETSHKNYFKENARGHNLGKLFLELQNAEPEFQIPNEETLKGKIKSIKTVIELNSTKWNEKKKKTIQSLTHFLFFLNKNFLIILWLILTHASPINESRCTEFYLLLTCFKTFAALRFAVGLGTITSYYRYSLAANALFYSLCVTSIRS